MAQQARADETLALIRRGDEDIRKQSYYQRIDTMHQLLDEYTKRKDAIDRSDLQNADELLSRWRQADERINSYIAVGNYQAATQVALGTGEQDSTPAFDRAGAGAEQRHRGEPPSTAQRHRRRTGGAVGRDGRRGPPVGGSRAGGDGGVVATDERVQMSEYR